MQVSNVPAWEQRDDDLPRVSLVVAVYNAAATLGDCIESLLQLDYPETHLQRLCVDNGSTDTSPQILAAYGDRLTVLNESTRGPAAARNRGIRDATGELVALTDADCIVDRHWLQHLVRPLRDSSVGIAGGTILSKRPCNPIEAFGEQIHDHNRAINEFRPPYVITMNWCARRSVVEELGGFNQDLLRASDVDFSYRVAQLGYRLAYQPEAIVYHQNERTPWGLAHEGYVHAVHAAPVHRLHAPFIARMQQERRFGARGVAWPSHPDHLPSSRSTALWAYLFNLGKRIGHRRATGGRSPLLG